MKLYLEYKISNIACFDSTVCPEFWGRFKKKKISGIGEVSAMKFGRYEDSP